MARTLINNPANLNRGIFICLIPKRPAGQSVAPARSAPINQLQQQFSKWPIMGMEKLIVIDKSGNVVRVK